MLNQVVIPYTYRLSKGNKPAAWLWTNIKNSYLFLLGIYEQTNIENVKLYADNYLETRPLDYIFNRDWSKDENHVEKTVYDEVVAYIRRSINSRHIKRLDAKSTSTCYNY